MTRNPRSRVNPIWSIERALANGYVMEPRCISICFSGDKRSSRPGHECAVHLEGINRDMVDPAMKDQTWGLRAKQCETQCDECAHICHMNDYIRGKPHCPPHFPVPALRTETGFKMYYGKDQKPERLVLGTWLIDRLNLRYLLYVFKWRVMI